AAVLVITAQHAHGLEVLFAEKQLGGQVRLANLEGDPRPPMARKLADQLLDHLRSDACTSAGWVDSEVENVQLGLVQFVNHEADDLFRLLGYHADAIALAQAAEKILLGPGEFEALLFG